MTVLDETMLDETARDGSQLDETVREDSVTVPAWSARTFSEDDKDDVLRLFEAPDFHFRTAHPDTRPEWEILSLLATDETFVLRAGGEVVGLYALEPIGEDHGCHYHLHLRLRGTVPQHWWSAAYDAIVGAVRWQTELIRISVQVGEYDGLGLRAMRSTALLEEGTLPDVAARGDRRYGHVFFGQIWTPES